MEEQLEGRSFILMGPAHSGKTAALHWLTRNADESQHTIWLDCRLWQTDTAFIGQLVEEVSLIFKRQLMRNVVIRENVSFKELNKIIEKEGV